MKEIPFETVYIHALVRDERGQKMSKSKGNTVDPLVLVENYGTDALRFTLAALVASGRDIKFSEDRLDGYSNFINKIWNATRFSLTALENISHVKDLEASQLTLPDKYIIYELDQLLANVTKALEGFHFTEAANYLYKFTWNEFCDWYLELSKPVLYGTDEKQKSASGTVLIQTLERLVRLLHPFIPFVTEEVYQKLPWGLAKESIMIQPYPTKDDKFLKLGSAKASEEIDLIKGVVTAIRNIRGENRISPAIKISLTIACEDKNVAESLQHNGAFISSLARLEKINWQTSVGETKKCAVSLVALGKTRVTVVIPLTGLVDFGEEIKRVEKELEKNRHDLELTLKKLGTETFMKNAPPEIIAQEKERQVQLLDKQAQLKESLNRFN